MLPRNIIDHIAAFVGVLNRDGTIVEINEAALRVSGSRREDVVGRKLWEAEWFNYDPDVSAEIKQGVMRAAEGRLVRFDTTARTLSGTILTIDFLIHPVLDENTGEVLSLVPSGIDITERKRFEDDLRRSLDLLERAQRVGQLGHWSYDIPTGKVSWSQVAKRIFVGEELVEPTPELVKRLIHTEDLERMRSDMLNSIEKGRRIQASYRVRRDDGEERIIEIEAEPDYGPTGEPMRIFGIVRDVTESRLKEQMLKEQQQLIDLSLEPIFYWDLDDGLRHWNPGCERVYGYTREEALGQDPHKLLSSQFPYPFWQIREQLLAGQSWSGEVLQRARDGRRVIVEARLDPAPTGGKMLVMEATRDVTARRKAEERLKLSEERLAIAAELTSLGTFDRDHSTDIVEITGNVCETVGGNKMTVEDLLAGVHPADLASVLDAVTRADDPKGDGIYTEEHRVVRSNGEVRWVSVKARTFFEGKGEARRPVRTIGAMLDVTERRNFDEQQRLLMGELNHRVRNTLSVVQAIASQTLRTSKDPHTFVEDFKGRIQSIATAYKLLNETTWQGANLTELLREQLSSSCGSGQVFTDGPEVWLPSQIALNLGLIIYELGTNARKYGALSVPGGRVQLSWNLIQAEDKTVLRLDWEEIGGPQVRPPTARGFGMGLIERTIGSTIEGDTKFDFKPEGLRCIIHFPLESPPPAASKMA